MNMITKKRPDDADLDDEIKKVVVPSDAQLDNAAKETISFLKKDDCAYTGKGEIEDIPHGFSEPFHSPNEKNAAPNVLRLAMKSLVIYGQGLQHYINELSADENIFDLSAAEIADACNHVFDDMVTKFNLEVMDMGLGGKQGNLAELTRKCTHPAGRSKWNNRFARQTLQSLSSLGLWTYEIHPTTRRYTIFAGPVLYAFFDDVYEPLVLELMEQMSL